MLPIPFVIRTLPFVMDLGTPVPALRPYLTAQFVGRGRQRIPYPTFLDTGSTYSVIPYRLATQLPWQDLGANLMLAGKALALEWHGIPCRMGQLEVELVDAGALVRTGPLHVVAKVATQPAPPRLEQAALLGMNFLADNHLRQELDATGASMAGCLWVP